MPWQNQISRSDYNASVDATLLVRSIANNAQGYQMGISRLKKENCGAAFGGKNAIGIDIDSILKREPKS